MKVFHHNIRLSLIWTGSQKHVRISQAQYSNIFLAYTLQCSILYYRINHGQVCFMHTYRWRGQFSYWNCALCSEGLKVLLCESLFHVLLISICSDNIYYQDCCTTGSNLRRLETFKKQAMLKFLVLQTSTNLDHLTNSQFKCHAHTPSIRYNLHRST